MSPGRVSPFALFSRAFVGCRMCWRITIWVFLAILLAEAAILVVSVKNFERERLSQIEVAAHAWMTTIIRVHQNNLDQQVLDLAATELPATFKILGIALYDHMGLKIGSVGDPPVITPGGQEIRPTARNIRSSDGALYDVVWDEASFDAPFTVVARLDTSDVITEVWEYIWRIVSLVLVITAVVTATAMVVLGFTVLRPLIDLHRQMALAAGDPDHPDAYVVERVGRDEIGEVAQAFNNMVRRLAAAIGAIRSQEAALISANEHLEERVRVRTRELSETNKTLRREAAQREAVEREFRQLARGDGANHLPILKITGAGTIASVDEQAQPLLAHWECGVGDPLPESLFSVAKDVARVSREAEVEVATGTKVFRLTFFPDEEAFVTIRVVDITSEKAAEQRLENLANRDVLTGLPNRTLLYDRLAQVIGQADRNRNLAALHLINFENFRDVNTTLGLVAGDAILQETADRLRQCTRTSDTVARLGADEFALVQVSPRDADSAATLAQKIIDELSRPFDVVGKSVVLGVNVGVTVYPTDGDDAEKLLTNANAALATARAEGARRFAFFVAGMNQEIRRRRLLENDLALALQKSEFELYYQPKLSAEDGSLSGTEALIRWHHGERGLLAPDEFIPIAERSRQIVAIGEWVLRQACRQVLDWQAAGMAPIKLAVNLSAVQFHEVSLPDLVARVLAETGLDPADLELEITESVVMQDVDSTLEILNKLHALGVMISVDDFGTGYSSLSYLRRFPVHRIKIDKSFVDGIGTEANAEKITQAVIALGHSLGVQVTAEGVENIAQIDYLKSAGCDEIQGYAISRPLNAEDFARRYK